MVTKVNFSLVQGDTFSKNCVFRVKSTGSPVNLTGATISGNVLAGGVYTPLSCTITDEVNGVFRFSLPSSTTATLPVGVAQIEVQITYSDTTVSTLFTGNLVISKQVA